MTNTQKPTTSKTTAAQGAKLIDSVAVKAKKRFNKEEWLKIVVPAMIASPLHGKKGPAEIVNSARQFIEALEKIDLN